MLNIFEQIAEGEPSEIIVGDYIAWKRSDVAAAYVPSSGYTAEYVARITDGGSTEIKLQQDASTTDEAFVFVVTSVVAELFLPGVYHWQLEVTQTSSGNRVVVDTGDFRAVADLDSNQADPRNHAEIMVAKIETILQGKADSDVASYSIAGRSLTKLSFQELLDAREFYKKEIVALRNAELVKKGKKNGATIKVRFV